MNADRVGATLTYHLADRLGSYVRGIDATGALSAQSTYTPYGNGGPTSGDDKRYTGQQQEPSSSLGLYYYKARFYSPVLGTFISADSVTKDGLNRYAYTKWNPVAYTDPTGRCVQDATGSWLECSRSTMVQFFSCAWGGTCNAGETDAVRRYAAGVILTDAFRYFVGLESASRGDILLRLSLDVTVKGLGRKLPLPGDDATGNFHFSVDVNATTRSFGFADSWFNKADGLGGYLDGWVQRTSRIYSSPQRVSFRSEAGPQASSLWEVVKNPFSLTGFSARVTWDLWFEANGTLSQEAIVSQRGGALRIVPDNVPFIDDLLVGTGMTLRVSEVPFAK